MARVSQDVIESLARKVLALRSEYEFATFWLGVRLAGPVSAEEAIATRKEINRRVGLRVLELAPDLTATLDDPEAQVRLSHPSGGVTLRVRPLLIYGRYRKLSREIPQSKWPCRRCHGSGCEACGGTGRRYERTVEELAAAPILAAARATGTKMHAVGREDVDARMLGRGRPFVLELGDPRVRTFALEPIQKQLNETLPGEVELQELQFADRALRRAVNSISPDKSYSALVDCLAPAQRTRLARLACLNGATIRQETPRRVLHRRPNRIRERAIRSCVWEIPPGEGPVRRFTVTLLVESGTYIKELISGDEGRTAPSIAQLLAVPCECAELDVLEVHCDPAADRERMRATNETGQDPRSG